jgi:hypothetical protein
MAATATGVASPAGPRRRPADWTGTADRLNRTVFLVLGGLFAAGGIAALLAGFDVFGSDVSGSALLTGPSRRFADRNHGWFWLAVGGGVGLLALLAVAWLVAQARTGRVVTLRLRSVDAKGAATRLAAAALTDALCDELEATRGVSRAHARVVGAQTAPRLRIHVTLDGTADVGEVRERVERDALAHARAAAALADMPADVRLTIPAARRRHVE